MLLKKWVHGEGKWDSYYSNWDKARARDFANIANMAMLITSYPAEKVSISSPYFARKWLERTEPLSRPFCPDDRDSRAYPALSYLG